MTKEVPIMRVLMILPLVAGLAGCETAEGFTNDVETATEAVID